MNHSLANCMKRFFSHYLPVQKGLSANTILAYRDAIKLLLCYTADTLGRPVDRLAIEDIAKGGCWFPGLLGTGAEVFLQDEKRQVGGHPQPVRLYRQRRAHLAAAVPENPRNPIETHAAQNG